MDKTKPSTDNKPSRQLGNKLAGLRLKRSLSRSRLIDKVYALLSPDDPLRRAITDSSLREIEEGNRVNTSRAMLETLCLALECTASERFDVMLAADKNVFAEPNGEVPNAAETLIRGLEIMYYSDSVVRAQIEVLLNNRSVSSLNEDELFEILETVFTMAATRRKREKKQKQGTPLSTGITVR